MTNRLATNSTQAIVWRWEGEAFGNTPAEELVGTSVNLRFPGQYYDSEANLHYNWNRYYDPSLGRYVTSDPIGLDGGLNTYNYVNQNPLVFYDLDGLKIDGGSNNKESTKQSGLQKAFWKLFGAKCKDSTDSWHTCSACCKTHKGNYSSGGGTICEEECLRTFNLICNDLPPYA
jgi:RHS repeat-associated protein